MPFFALLFFLGHAALLFGIGVELVHIRKAMERLSPPPQDPQP